MAYAIGVAQPGVDPGRDVRHRDGRPGADRGRRQRGLRPAPGGHHPRPRPAPADLPEDRGLRPLRPRRQGVHLGGDHPARRPEVARSASEPPPIATGDRPGPARRAGHRQGRSTTSSPTRWRTEVRVGTMVRVELHGRRVGGWVVGRRRRAAGRAWRCSPLAKVTGWGPPPDVVDLAGWAAWRWAGRPAALPAAPRRRRGAVQGLPPPGRAGAARPAGRRPGRGGAVAGPAPCCGCRRRPTRSRVVLAAAGPGQRARGGAVGREAPPRWPPRLRRAGVPGRAAARGSGPGPRPAADVVVGARAAAWAPVADLAAVVVLDEHDEAYQEERAPTWHARDVAVERARRAGRAVRAGVAVPVARGAGVGRRCVAPSPGRRAGRAGRSSTWSTGAATTRRAPACTRDRLVDARCAAGGRVVCVLNRTGRARLLACAACGELARCERVRGGGRAARGRARCAAGAAAPSRPPVVRRRAAAPGSKPLRVGVTRAREELEALAGEPVGRGDRRRPSGDCPTPGSYVGTEAVLHRVPRRRRGRLPRLRPGAAGAPLPGRRAGAGAAGPGRPPGRRPAGGGRLLVQTRLPDHEVLAGRAPRRPGPGGRRRARAGGRLLGFPPVTALAAVSRRRRPTPSSTRFGRRSASRCSARADGALAAAGPRPPDAVRRPGRDAPPAGRLRVEVDPLRL